MRTALLLAGLTTLLLGGCISVPATSTEGPLFFEVEFSGTPQGLDPSQPGTFSTTAVASRSSLAWR